MSASNPDQQCTGPFSSASDCPAHRPSIESSNLTQADPPETLKMLTWIWNELPLSAKARLMSAGVSPDPILLALREREHQAAEITRLTPMQSALDNVALCARRALSYGHQATPQTDARMVEVKESLLRQIVDFCANVGVQGSILRDAQTRAEQAESEITRLTQARAQDQQRLFHTESAATQLLERAEQAERRERAAFEWQPIETAPKDGQSMLLWAGDLCIGNWNEWAFTAEELARCRPGTPNPFTGWCDDYTGEPMDASPTHWMPLPTVPDTAYQAHIQEPTS